MHTGSARNFNAPGELAEGNHRGLVAGVDLNLLTGQSFYPEDEKN